MRGFTTPLGTLLTIRYSWTKTPNEKACSIVKSDSCANKYALRSISFHFWIPSSTQNQVVKFWFRRMTVKLGSPHLPPLAYGGKSSHHNASSETPGGELFRVPETWPSTQNLFLVGCTQTGRCTAKAVLYQPTRQHAHMLAIPDLKRTGPTLSHCTFFSQMYFCFIVLTP